MHRISIILKKPILKFAAWYCCLTPLVVGISIFLYGYFFIEHAKVYIDHQASQQFHELAMWVCASSIIAGIVSLFGVYLHKQFWILSVAVIGILLSIVVGYVAFVSFVLSGITC